MSYEFFAIGIALIFGFICKTIAKNKNRSQGWAFFWGFFFGLIALVVYLFLGKVEEEKPIKRKRKKKK